jgi:hypothetical protein
MHITNKGKNMKDFSMEYLAAKRLLEEYYRAMIAQDRQKASEIANNLVENALKLEDIAHEN